jgi:hypothetical protein
VSHSECSSCQRRSQWRTSTSLVGELARRSVGVSGSAVLFGTAGLYLVYVGVKDVPFLEGLRSLLRKEVPTPKATHSPYAPDARPGIGTIVPTDDLVSARLVGNAKTGYAAIRALGGWTIYGWGIRPDLTSDHPKGLAIDVMRPTEAEAQKIISTFRGTPGAKYWIWNRQIANVAVDNWRIRPYNGASPHTDHVHLSWS